MFCTFKMLRSLSSIKLNKLLMNSCRYESMYFYHIIETNQTKLLKPLFFVSLRNIERKNFSVNNQTIGKTLTHNINNIDNINTDNTTENAEKEKQKARQQKVMKYTLLVMSSLFSGFVFYGLWEWGKPAYDDEGNVIEDRFSSMSIPWQYLYRSWDALWHYNQVLKEPTRELLLPPPLPYPYQQPPYTLVLEMTGVLVHPEWTYKTGWRFKKRPYVDYFLQQCATSGLFEIVIYTYEQGFTAFPLLDSLDPNGFIMYRLFRDSTRYENGAHIKDLNRLNRDLSRVIHIDWNANACQLNTSNCFALKKWNGDSSDRTLYDLSHFLRAIAVEGVKDVRDVITHYSQFDDPLEVFKENQRKLALQEQEKQQTQTQTPQSLSKFIFNSWKK